MRILLLFSLLIVVLAGCSAALTKDDCLLGNWEAVGLRDGRVGASTARIIERRAECKEYNVKIDTKAYTEGYARGLIQYCTYETGYKIGSKGGKKRRVCPAPFDEAYEKGYSRGLAQYQLNQEKIQQNQEETARLMNSTGVFGELRNQTEEEYEEELRERESELRQKQLDNALEERRDTKKQGKVKTEEVPSQ